MSKQSWPIFVFSSRLRNEQVNGSKGISIVSVWAFFFLFCEDLIPPIIFNYENL